MGKEDVEPSQHGTGMTAEEVRIERVLVDSEVIVQVIILVLTLCQLTVTGRADGVVPERSGPFLLFTTRDVRDFMRAVLVGTEG